MKISRNSGSTVVTLSERNLLSLLVKLWQPDSYRTLTIRDEDQHLLIVQAEADETHYDRDPGPISAESQILLDLVKEARDEISV